MNEYMQIIVPSEITDARLVSSTIAEPAAGETLWNAATAYTVGQEAIRLTTHKKYKRLVAGTTATLPENDTVNWLDIGSTNRWAMFDDVVGTRSTTTTALTTVINTAGVGGLYLAELIGRTVLIELKDSPGGSVVYTKTVDLDGTIITSFYDWFYLPYEQLTEFTVLDMPYHYTDAQITTSITGTGTVQCGVMKYGPNYIIGKTQYGATSSIIDYSRKEQDAFGRYNIVERAFSKRASFDIFTEKGDYNKISKILQQIRATPAVYVGTSYSGYEPLTVYGFYRDFSINVQYPTVHFCSLEVEGLI